MFSLGDIPAATAEDVEIAVDAARRAFSRNGGKDWASTSGAFRAKFLRAIASTVFDSYCFPYGKTWPFFWKFLLPL